jgi:hypothetical protein
MALRLREVKDCICVGVLQVVGKTELGLAINAAFVASSRDPRPAGVAAPIADVQSLLEQAPVRFGADRKTQTRAARGQRCLADGTRHHMPSFDFCLLFVYYACPNSAGRRPAR